MSNPGSLYTFRMRTQQLHRDHDGKAVWQVSEQEKVVPAAQTALLLCDIWDNHWSRGANLRLAQMLERMNTVVETARRRGSLIIHAPSETMDFYTDTPPRTRIATAPRCELPALSEHPDPPLPVDASDGGSDTGETSWYKAWSRQHPAIRIDHAQDAVSDNGEEIHSYLQHRGIRQVVIMGVHTNMCILNRSFAIKASVRRGIPVALLRDLTDTMYNPARPPYVSHDEGTRLVIEFIEKFWCPTVTSADLLEHAAQNEVESESNPG